jgi:uncharacterized protein YprB with RNaseH-like and TPR domain
LWKAGVATWDDFSDNCDSVGGQVKDKVLKHLTHSRKAFDCGKAGWFLDRLPASESWRILNWFPKSTAYLDIETTGLWRGSDHITTVALFDGKSLKTYVRGRNLQSLKKDLQNYSLIVTYNGKCFDLPFIEDDLKFKISVPDVDLRYLCASIGWTGGLKRVEKKVGLKRPRALSLLDGVDAPILWDKHLNGHKHALPTLLAYNCADAVSLQTIAQLLFNEKVGKRFKRLRVPVERHNYTFSHKPDLRLINRLKREIDFRPF